MIAATVFEACFLAPVYLFLAIGVILGVMVFAVWVLSCLERLMQGEKKPDPKELSQIYCPKCGELVHLSNAAIDAAKAAEVAIRCGCGNVVRVRS